MHHKLLVAPLLLLVAACDGSNPKPIIIDQQSCNIEEPASKTEVSVNRKFRLAGWFFDKSTANANGDLRMQVSSPDRKVITSIPIDTMMPRTDVASAFNKVAGSENSGWAVTFPIQALPPGTYDVSLIRETGETIVVCFNGHSVTVK